MKCSIDAGRLGSHLASLRCQLHITQKDLAARLGITSQQIQKYEKGLIIPTVYRLSCIADIFKTSVCHILSHCERVDSSVRSTGYTCQVFSKDDLPLMITISRCFQGIKSSSVKARVVALIEAMRQ